MKRICRNDNPVYRSHRKLLTESLEQRQLMAVMPIGLDAVALAPAALKPSLDTVAAEVQTLFSTIPLQHGRVSVDQNKSTENLQQGMQDRIQSTLGKGGDSLTPSGDISIPETIYVPLFDKIPERFIPLDKIPNSPVDGRLDPGKLPGRGCGPDREPPEYNPSNEEPYLRYWEQQDVWDISDEGPRSSFWNAGCENKVQNWGSSHGNPLIRTNQGNGGGDSKDSGQKDNNDKNNDTKDTEIKDTAKPIEDDQGGKPTEKDPNPEGGDPDELWSPAARNAALYDRVFEMQYQMGKGSGLPSPTGTSGRKGVGLWGVDPLIHPFPRPDVVNSPLSTEDFGFISTSGYNSYPTPDDPNGPIDPRASDSVCIALDRFFQSTSPPDGGQGNQPIPPRPEF